MFSFALIKLQFGSTFLLLYVNLVLGFMQLPSSNFLRSSGSSRRAATSSNRDAVIISSEADLSHPNTTSVSPAALRKISSGRRSSPVVSSEHRTPSGRNASTIKNLETTLRGIHFNNDERVKF